MLGHVCLCLGRLGKKSGYWAKGHLGSGEGEGLLGLGGIRFFLVLLGLWVSGTLGFDK